MAWGGIEPPTQGFSVPDTPPASAKKRNGFLPVGAWLPNPVPNAFGPVGCIAIRFFYVNQRNSDTDRRTSPTEPMAQNSGDAGGPQTRPSSATVLGRYAVTAGVELTGASLGDIEAKVRHNVPGLMDCGGVSVLQIMHGPMLDQQFWLLVIATPRKDICRSPALWPGLQPDRGFDLTLYSLGLMSCKMKIIHPHEQ